MYICYCILLAIPIANDWAKVADPGLNMATHPDSGLYIVVIGHIRVPATYKLRGYFLNNYL